MIICGLKLTHDGAIALIDGDKLVFSVEIEKLDNNARYSPVKDLEIVTRVLESFGYKASDIDEWVIDGWDGKQKGQVSLLNHGQPLDLVLAPYHEGGRHNVLHPFYHGTVPIAGNEKAYTSYLHVAGHLIGTYCTSQFAKDGESSFGLVWDGGMFPRLYYIDPKAGIVENGGPLFPLIGHFYATAGHHFGPYRRQDQARTADDLSVAGKLMAYIGLGTPREPVIDQLHSTYLRLFEDETPAVAEYREVIGGWGTSVEPSMSYVHPFFQEVRKNLEGSGFSDEDILASVHEFLERLLVQRVVNRVKEWKGDGPWNLCFAGGCALNIKWNSALRAHPMFRAVWVPPFPNDSGSALGVACVHRAARKGLAALDWHPRSGPNLVKTSTVPVGWEAYPCSTKQLANILYETDAPVVLLHGRAEIGPRALGGRSIIAAATSPQMKDLLNQVKGRESFRPVAPLCLTEMAPEIFDPGTPDPHMLFDHFVRDDWKGRIPAVLHLDGTARLQTVSQADCPVLESILREYYRLSGIPVLCNTSANYNGRGFFPDVASAIAWGKIDRVWSDNVLYKRIAS